MQAGLIRAMVGVLAFLMLVPAVTRAQEAAPQAAPAAQGAPPAQGAPVFKPEELDQMLAPIALYPDQLLAQILMASTYPLEIVQAERWVKDPNNTQLKGEELDAALQPQPWDPSVKSLVPIPQVLQ